MKNQDFWNNKNVLITGHTGFKGMWLTLILKSLNASLTGVSKVGKGSSLYETLDSKKYFDDEYFFDISDEINSENKNIFSKNQFDIVFHFAAQSLVPIATQDPLGTLRSNILGTYNIIQMCIEYTTTSSLVIATTDKVYKDSSNFNNEDSQLGGKEFYSSSKVAQEMVIEAFKTYESNKSLNLSTVRSGNVLGPGDGAPHRLLTDLIYSLDNNNDVLLRNPNSIRPWQDIFDSLQGYILVAERNYTKKIGDIFNLNTDINSEITSREIAEKMINLWNSKIKIIESEKNDFYEASMLRLDSSKAKKVLGWESKLNIDDTLEKIVEWEKNKNIDVCEKISFKQIDQYFLN